MKAYLEFNLPEDREQFEGAVKALDFWCCLLDLDDYLRGEIKYADNKCAQDIRSKLGAILADHNVTLEEYS